MLRQYIPHDLWEDWPAGLFALSFSTHDVDASLALLGNCELLAEQMRAVITEWPNSSLHNLSNINRNRQAWLGQAACCLHHGSTEDATKEAWRRLTREQQNTANAIADLVISEWEGAQNNAENLF